MLAMPCGSYTACPNGPLSLRLEPRPSGGFPPAPYDPGYTIQPCDSVTWSFGDGTTETVTGTGDVVHTYSEPGNYAIDVTITNSLGSATIRAAQSLVIASAPSRLSFTTATVPYPRYPFGVCVSCVVAAENAGAVTIEVVRSLDTSRAVSARVEIHTSHIVPTVAKISELVAFAPGETRKTITVPIVDDAVYYGPRWYPLHFGSPTGGVLTVENTSYQPQLFIYEDEAQPVVSIAESVSVLEGFSGRTPYSIPVSLSAPMILDVSADVFMESGSATEADFVHEVGSLRIRPGETSGVITGFVNGDTLFEPDETFVVRLVPRHTNGDPAFGNTRATVTIVNDDPATAPVAIPLLDPRALLVLAVAVAVVALKMIR